MNVIEQKIEYISQLLFSTDTKDTSSFTVLLTELKTLEALLNDQKNHEVVHHYPGLLKIVCDSAAFAAKQINSSMDSELVFKSLSSCIANLQEVIMNRRDPATLNFPFEVAKTEGNEGASSTPAFEADSALIEEFIEKQKTDLDDIEALILKLETDEKDTALAAIKRLVHTCKGEAGVLNLMDIQLVCHEAESYVEKGAQPGLVDKLLAVKDWLSAKNKGLAGASTEGLDSAQQLIQKLFSCAPAATPVPAPQPASAPPAPANNENAVSAGGKGIDISFIPDPNHSFSLDDEDFIREFLNEGKDHLANSDHAVLELEKNPGDKDSINMIFRAYHTIKGISGMLNLDNVKTVAHASENLLDMARQDKIPVTPKFIDVIFSATDKLKLYMDEIEKGLTSTKTIAFDLNAENFTKQINEAIFGSGGQSKPVATVSPAPVVTAPESTPSPVVTAAESKPAPDVTTEKSAPQPAPSPVVAQATAAPTAIESVVSNPAAMASIAVDNRPKQENKGVAKLKEMIKVDTEVLDKILNTIGELVISESMVQRDAIQAGQLPEHAYRNLRQLEKITRELQDMGTSLRMTSIKPLFEKMARLVRDVAKKTGKLVNFVMEGEDTELDRNVVERISDPLIHMIRNSVDHGIEENAEARAKSGKKPAGTVTLRAFYEGGSVHIQIQDDGRGLNKDAIIKKAIEKGLIADAQKMTDEEIFNMVFLPGFSTAKVVTDVSGRGVGMDVVKRNIEALRGRIDIKSTVGNGSTFTIILPLTLAIIDGMIVEIGQEKFIIPTLHIKESIQLKREQFNLAFGKGESVMIREELIPVYRLNQMFSIDTLERENDNSLLVVVENAGKQVGLMVDQLVGQQQIVIKNLGGMFKALKGFSGGAIMADGSVGLILDIATLIDVGQEGACAAMY